MSAIVPPLNAAAQSLKQAALCKLAQAQALVSEAREDLCNLEGSGYCESYEALATTRNELERHQNTLRRLQPPTGVFII